MAGDCLESLLEVRVGSDHYPSSLVHPSSHRELGAPDADVVGTQYSVGAREDLQSRLVRAHRNRPSWARPKPH